MVAGGSVEGLRGKDDLINRIISPSILSQLCEDVGGEQENQLSPFIYETLPSCPCRRSERNGKDEGVFLHPEGEFVVVLSCVFAVNFLPPLCFPHVWLVGHGEQAHIKQVYTDALGELHHPTSSQPRRFMGCRLVFVGVI